MAEDMNGADREQEKQEKKLGNVIGNPPKPTDPRINEAMGDAGLETCLTAEDVARAGDMAPGTTSAASFPSPPIPPTSRPLCAMRRTSKSRRQRKGGRASAGSRPRRRNKLHLVSVSYHGSL
ncbi:hypothetical protein HPP92_028011 [Vanilla planifolia]|uniref:Uncharacterized protein n=1 Tax=Vanilla planifolia TaxID=51239 RepID=A0A835U3F2_VANPL|nr:hypothetical protein HPP92_028011 [Vanilla planifolia]